MLFTTILLSTLVSLAASQNLTRSLLMNGPNPFFDELRKVFKPAKEVARHRIPVPELCVKEMVLTHNNSLSSCESKRQKAWEVLFDDSKRNWTICMCDDPGILFTTDQLIANISMVPEQLRKSVDYFLGLVKPNATNFVAYASGHQKKVVFFWLSFEIILVGYKPRS